MFWKKKKVGGGKPPGTWPRPSLPPAGRSQPTPRPSSVSAHQKARARSPLPSFSPLLWLSRRTRKSASSLPPFLSSPSNPTRARTGRVSITEISRFPVNRAQPSLLEAHDSPLLPPLSHLFAFVADPAAPRRRLDLRRGASPRRRGNLGSWP